MPKAQCRMLNTQRIDSCEHRALGIGRWALASYPVLRKPQSVLVRPLIARELLREAFVVPDLEVIDLAEHAYIADDRRAVAQQLGHDDATLRVELALLAVVADAIEKLEARRMVGRHLREPLLDLEPHAHRIDAHRFAGHARD